jgi:PAS domain S-box-containing protein
VGSAQTAESFRTRERVELALRSAGTGLWEIDFDVGTLRWDEQHERLAGLAPGTFRGKDHFYELVHPDDVPGVYAAARRAVETGTLVGAYRLVRPDGAVRWFEGKGTLTPGDRHVAFGITHDVTDRFELEERLRQNEKLQAIGQLAGGIAHDFNNSLQVIIGYAALLERELAGTPHADKLAQLRAAAGRSAGLTKQLLAFGRKQALRMQTIDVNEFLADAAARLQRLLGAHVVVATELYAGVSTIEADPTQIEQIVLNLGTNARDAMPAGGRFRIATKNVTLDETWLRGKETAAGPGLFVCIRFSDTGPGIDPEIRDRLFEPFFTTKPVGSGTGLGLASVYGIVKQSGGHIEVGDDDGGGASFAVYLPVA